MTDSFEDLHKRLLAAQQQLYFKKHLKGYSVEEQEVIMSQFILLENSVKKQIDDQLNNKVIIITIDEVHEQAKKMVLQRMLETFGLNMTIVNVYPYPWPTCPTGYQCKYLKVGDVPGNVIGMEYTKSVFVRNLHVFDGRRLFNI